MKLNVFRPMWLALVALFSVSACGDYEVNLPNGYSLVRTYASAVLISDLQHLIVIHPNVENYKVLDGVVVGHVNTPDGLVPEDKELSKPGYFILNTKTHEAKQGLDKKVWLESLQALGITNEPSLSKPSR